MMCFKRLLLILLLAAGTTALGCQREPGDKIIVGIEHFPRTLDPRFVMDTYGVRIAALVFSGLTRIDDKLEIVPDVAESWQIVNPTEIRFKIRGGIRFHDGSVLTADDVLATYRFIQKTPRSVYNKELNRIEGFHTFSDTEFSIRLKQPYAPLLDLLQIGILPKRLAQKDTLTSSEFIGCGPYKLATYVPEQHLLLTPNTFFFGETVANKGVRFTLIPDASVRALELEKQSVDIVQNALHHELLQKLAADAHLSVITSPGTSLTYMGFNLKDPILKHIAVRKAIAHLIDRVSLVKAKFAGRATLATGMLPAMSWAYEKNVATYNLDIRKANALLDDVGFKRNPKTGVRFQLVYKTSTDQQRIEIAQIIARQLAEGGINVEVKPFEFGTLYSHIIDGNFQIYTLKWTDVTEPHFLYAAFHSANFPPEGLNRNRYKNSDVDRLIEGASQMLDTKERKRAYSRLQKITADELPYVFLWLEDQVAVVNRRIENYRLKPTGDFSGLPKAIIRGGRY